MMPLYIHLSLFCFFSFKNTFCTSMSRTNQEEQNYLDLVKQIITSDKTVHRQHERTGSITHSLFGAQLRFSLANNQFPLLTTKRMFWRGIVEELLWMLRGCTDSKQLAAKGVHIWDANGTLEFMRTQIPNFDKTNRKEGDLGPIYGFQWRHYGAKYVNCETNYSGQGVDQITKLIHTIKTNPTDRRMILCAWNPKDLDQMALPPCHMFCQFFVDTTSHTLSCQMYQRSADIGLGVPFNIASYSLLTIMIAHLCGLKPGEFVHVMGDAHVYDEHVDYLLQQCTLTPNCFPKLFISNTKPIKKIEDFCFEDFVITEYSPIREKNNDSVNKMRMIC